MNPPLIPKNWQIFFNQRCFVPRLIECGSMVLKKIFCKSSMYFYNYQWKVSSFISINLNLSKCNDKLCKVCMKLAQWFWRMRWKFENFRDRRQTTIRETHLSFQRCWGNITFYLIFILTVVINKIIWVLKIFYKLTKQIHMSQQNS